MTRITLVLCLAALTALSACGAEGDPVAVGATLSGEAKIGVRG